MRAERERQRIEQQEKRKEEMEKKRKENEEKEAKAAGVSFLRRDGARTKRSLSARGFSVGPSTGISSLVFFCCF